MKNQSGIYEIFNRVDGKRYIGQASNFQERWKRHRMQLVRGKHHSRLLQRAWNKHGAEAFVFHVILTCAKTKEMLCFYEQQLLDKVKPEYNSDPIAGTRLGAKLSPEQCAHKAEMMKKRWADDRGGMISTVCGQAWKNGGGHTDDTKKRISDKKTGVPRPMGAGTKTADALRGKKRPIEVGQKISATSTGVPKPRPSEATRNKLREAQQIRRLREGCTLHPERVSVSHYIRIEDRA